jgi:hypothetical protein
MLASPLSPEGQIILKHLFWVCSVSKYNAMPSETWYDHSMSTREKLNECTFCILKVSVDTEFCPMVSGSLRVLRLLRPLKLVAMIHLYNWNITESGIKHQKSTNKNTKKSEFCLTQNVLDIVIWASVSFYYFKRWFLLVAFILGNH